MKKVNLEFELGKKISKNGKAEELSKHLTKLFDDTNMMLIVTENGTSIVGSGPNIAVGLTQLISHMRESVPDTILKHAFDLAFKDEDEILKEIKEMSSELLGKTKNKASDDDEEDDDAETNAKEIKEALKEVLNDLKKMFE